MILPIGTLLGGRYEIVEKIGAGGMAIVYRAKDSKLERFVTVKVLREEFTTDEEFKSRFKIEARSAASLSHTNIVNVYDVGEDGGVYYIVMEYVHGDTLKKAILDKAPFDTLTTLSVAIQMASALSHAHKNHIIHRDIKPQNILVAVDGTIKVTDFGIARAATAATVTTTANALGSVHYFSPEQARGGYVDEKSDIYSLGITMFEMITGKLPFEGDTSVSVALKHLNDELPNIRNYNPNVSKSLEGIIKKATRKKADERYSNIDLLLSDLKRALSDSTGEFIKSENNISQSSQREIEYMNTVKNKNVDSNNELDEIKIEILDSLSRRKSEAHSTASLPESNVGFDKYKKKLKISKDDDYSDDYEQMPNDISSDEEDYDDSDYEDKRQEKKVIIAAIITALLIIGVISVFGMKLLNNNPKSTDKIETVTENTVPSFEGMTLAQAQIKAEELKITLVKGVDANSSKYAEGLIMRQSVAVGEEIKKDMEITVDISLGLASIDMPNVTGKEEDIAKDEILSAVESEAAMEYEFNDDIPVGIVLKQQPSKGVKVNKGDKVTLTISKGEEPKMVVVPNVQGKTEAEAKKEIEALGLVVGAITNAESDTVEKGIVITQTVKAGEEVSKNSIVALVISKGKAEVVPEPPVETPTETPKDVSKSFSISVPMGQTYGETVHVKVLQVGENGEEKVVMDSNKSLSEFPFNITVTGKGKAEIKCFLDDQYQWSENVNFSEGGN